MERFVVLAELRRSPLSGYAPLTSLLMHQHACVEFGKANWLVETDLDEQEFVDTLRQRVDFEDRLVVLKIDKLAGLLGDYASTPWRAAVNELGW